MGGVATAQVEIFWFGIILNIVVILISLGTITPLSGWFYMIPVFGQIHLPIRYLIITLPFLFLSLKLVWKYMEIRDNKLNEKLYIGITAGTGLMFLLQIAGSEQNIFQFDLLRYNVIWAIIILYFSNHFGWKNRKTVFCLLTVLLLSAGKEFYGIQQVYTYKVDSQSIALDQPALNRLDAFIDKLPQSERYLFVEQDTIESVPGIVLNHLEFYPWHRYHVTNLLAYPLHGSTMYKDYSVNNQIGWFNLFNWGYLLDVRADFIILDQDAYNQNAALYEQIIDQTIEPTWLTQTLYMYKLKKFIPTPFREYPGVSDSASAIYNGVVYYEDLTNCFDNGIFYSPMLRKENVYSFSTDRRTYYQLDVEMPEDGELLFFALCRSIFAFFD